MFYLYKPKYNALYGPFNSMEEAQKVGDKLGGIMKFYDHEPSIDEKMQTQAWYFDVDYETIKAHTLQNSQ
jgi:hypothetical protein